MADIINLKRFKKRQQRERSAGEAEANRARFGRTKAERARDQQRERRTSELLDQHRLEDGRKP